MDTGNRKQVVGWAFAVLVVVAVGTLLWSREPSPEPDDPVEPLGHVRALRFNWPVPSEALVIEQDVRQTDAYRLRYRLEVTAGPGPGLYHIGKRDIEIIEVNMLEVNDEVFGKEIAPFMLRYVTPDLIVDSRGDLVGMEDWDEFIQRLDGLMEELIIKGSIAPEHRANTLQRLQQEEVRQVVAEQAVRPWSTWVNGWLHPNGRPLDFTENAEFTELRPTPMLSGEIQDTPFVFRHEGPDPDDPDHVRLTSENEYAFGDNEVENTIWVVTRPETMQPLRAESRHRRRTKSAPGGRERIQVNQYAFDWAR